MSEQLPHAPQQPPPKAKGLTPVQIGAGVGAALTVLILFGLRDLLPQGGGNVSNFLIGVCGAIGAMLGMAIVSLVNLIRHRKRGEAVPDTVAGEKPDAAVHPAIAPEAQAEGNGSPILRVAAGGLGLLFAGILPLMIAQGGGTWGGAVFMVALALMFGWYAVRGRKGLPQFLTKK